MSYSYFLLIITDVDWDSEQCVQNCGQNNIDRLSCGGRKSNLPSSEVYTTPQACCYEMLSYISLDECVKSCPYAYDPELSYDELDVVLIENTNEVYQCKPWPENLYCNQFPPKYKVVAPGNNAPIHKPNLGWMKLGTCDENGLNGQGVDYEALDMMRDSRTYNDEQNMMTAAMSPAMRNQRKRQKYERKKAKKQRQKAMRQQFGFVNTMPKATQGYVLTTIDDAHIYKAQQDRNGNDSALNLYNSRSASDYDIDLEALVKFDVSSVNPNNMKEAILQLVPLVHCEEELNIEIMADNQDWYEEEVTWRTAPKRTGPSNINIPEYDVLHKNVWFNIDVTNAIQWGIREQGQRYVTFKITIVGYSGTKADPTSSSCVLASKEYMDGKYAPSLEIRTDGRSGGGSGGGASSTGGSSGGTGIYSESQYDDTSSSSKQEDYHTSLHGKESINNGRVPKHPDYEHPEWEPITREGTQHMWYADYSLGSEGGECVRNCKRTSDPNCGGGVAVKDWWLDLYTSPETCCKEKLWWMTMRECVPGLYE